MKKYLHRLMRLLAIASVAMSFFAVVQPAHAYARAVDDICAGVNTGAEERCGSPVSGNKIGGVVRTAINILSVVVAITAVIMIVIGGLKYVTSGGDSARVNSARETILYAVIGLIIVALAQILVRFVLTKTG